MSGTAVFKEAMSLLLRYLVVLVRGLWAPRADILAESMLQFRVMPDDLDVNVHMNNGRYLALMDLARFDLMVRARLYRPGGHRQRWPVLGSTMVRYRRSLQPFQVFQLHTRLLGWDDRWFVFEQRFQREGLVYCTGLARGMFRTPQGNVTPVEALRGAGLDTQSPSLPEYVRQWMGADEGAYAAGVRATEEGMPG
jgi:acyl-CoA thioesterase FadM